MKSFLILLAALCAVVVAYLIGASGQLVVDQEAANQAKVAIDALSVELQKSPTLPGLPNKLKELKESTSRLGAKDLKEIEPVLERLSKEIANSLASEVNQREAALDKANDASLKIRNLRQKLREFKVTRESPTVVQSLGQDLRSALRSFAGLNALILLCVALICYAVFFESGRTHVKNLITSISFLKFGNFELSFKGFGRETTVAQIRNLTSEVTKDVLGSTAKFQLTNRIQTVLRDPEVLKALGKDKVEEIPDFRATMHIADPLFSRTFIQVAPYLPLRTADSRRPGRRRSVHFGAIGIAWTDKDRASICENVEGDFVEAYNMDHAQARDRKEQSYAVICLPRDGQEAKAVLYMESSARDQFQDTEAIKKAVQKAAKDLELSDKLETMYTELKCDEPVIRIQEDADATL